MENYLEDLIRLAHSFYGETTIFEVIDADRNAAIEWMIEMLRLSIYYGFRDMEKMEWYLAILDVVREWEG